MTLIDWWLPEERARIDRLHDEITELHRRHDALPHWRWIKRAGIEHKIVHKQRLLSIHAEEADYSAWHRSFEKQRRKQREDT